MKKLSVIIMVMLAWFFLLQGQDLEKEKATIKKVVISAYQEGISNQGDVELIKKGFHPEFNLLGIGRDGNLWKLPIAKWIESVKKKKEAGKYPPKEKISFKFHFIDIVGHAAITKLDYYRGKKLAYTDYLSLYKFEKGWQIVNKIYYQHK